MNVTITKNNLLIIAKQLEENKKPSEKSKAYLQFIKDGITAIEILNIMVDDLNNTIAVNFRSEVVKKIEEKQAFRQSKVLNDEIRLLKLELDQLKATNQELLKSVEV